MAILDYSGEIDLLQFTLVRFRFGTLIVVYNLLIMKGRAALILTRTIYYFKFTMIIY